MIYTPNIDPYAYNYKTSPEIMEMNINEKCESTSSN